MAILRFRSDGPDVGAAARGGAALKRADFRRVLLDSAEGGNACFSHSSNLVDLSVVCSDITCCCAAFESRGSVSPCAMSLSLSL